MKMETIKNSRGKKCGCALQYDDFMGITPHKVSDTTDAPKQATETQTQTNK